MVTQWIADLESAESNVRVRALEKLQNADLESADFNFRPHAQNLLASLLAILRKGGEPTQERLAMRSLLRLPLRLSWWDAYPISLWYQQKELMQLRADRIIPCLTDLLTDSDEYVRSRTVETLAGYGSQAAHIGPALVAALNDRSPTVCLGVAKALTAVDPGRKSEAIAVLLPLLSNPEATQSVCDALREFGEDPVPHLLALLRQHTGEAQLPYIQALKYIGEPSIPALRQELQASSVAGRLGAARTLGLLGYRAQAAVEDVVTALQDPDAEVRCEAARALVEIDGPRAGPALPVLIHGLDSTDAMVRGEVIRLLVRMGPAAEPALPALAKLLTDPEVGLKAALALVEINAPKAAPAVPVLMEALERFDSAGQLNLMWQLLEALGRIGVPAAAAAPLIRKSLQNKDQWVRISAASALARVAPGAPEWKADAVKSLMPVVTEEGNGDLFWEALAALVAIGPAAGDVVPHLEVMLLDEEKRSMAEMMCPGDPVAMLFSALAKIDPTAAARVLKDRRAEGQWDSLLKALGELGPAVSPLVPVLQELLPDTTPERAGQLKELLARIK